MRQRAWEGGLRFTALVLAFCTVCAVLLPWFRLPVLGLSLPAPAWNRTGLFFIALAALLVGRALGWGALRWPVRALLVPAAYHWWNAEQLIRSWGTGKFAPLQLQLSEVNAMLIKLGREEIQLYDPILWKELTPEYGWGVAGASLLGVAIHTLWDGPRRRKCGNCARWAPLEDAHCSACGERFPNASSCRQCGAVPGSKDRYCRRCGGGLRRSVKDSTPGVHRSDEPNRGSPDES